MSFWFLLAGFLGAANPGRVALATSGSDGRRDLLVALALGAALIAVATVAADELLEALAISPESFRIAAGLVVGVVGLGTLAWTRAPAGPIGAALVTPELASLAISFGADEPTGEALGAAAIALAVVALAGSARRGRGAVVLARFMAAAAATVGVGLIVSGVRSV